MLSSSDVWVLTGFGSRYLCSFSAMLRFQTVDSLAVLRGLIHHALLGEMMAKAVMHRDPSHLPPELLKSSPLFMTTEPVT